jgi:hypothetical protein
MGVAPVGDADLSGNDVRSRGAKLFMPFRSQVNRADEGPPSSG